jgi:salicylate hydroxylase
MTQRVLRAAIVGGGIGGLTAALALQRAGVDFRVYEQAEEFTEVGAGVALGPNAVRLLNRLGLESRLDAIASQPSAYQRRRWHDGKVIVDSRTSGLLGRRMSLTVHRAQLLDILASGVDERYLEPGKRCTAVEQRDDEVHLTFDDGSTAVADTVVGADGIHSVVRSAYQQDAPVFSGKIAYRGLVPMERLSFLGEDRHLHRMWLGPNQHFLTYPIAAGAMMNVVAFVPADDSWAVESWSAPGEVERLAEHFEGWDRTVLGIIGALDRTMRWALYDREPLPQWTFGRVTLLGDAAHSMLPHQGQGAGQSVEDAIVLARCLERARPDTVETYLHLYERIRKDRTGRVQSASRQSGEIYDLTDPEEQERRAASTLATKGEWLWGYDADEEFDKAVAGTNA